MIHATQARRQLAVFSPLGDDKLLLRSFAGREEMSRLFRYDLQLLSEDESIKPADLVGKALSFVVRRPDGSPRYFSGFVKQFVAGPKAGLARFRQYRAEVVPWLWFLTQTADCRIFQNKSVPEIIEQIFRDLGFTDFTRTGLRGSYQKRVYCVQYRETDFDFVSRLMEEEGVGYFFRHEKGKHVLNLIDNPGSYPSSPKAKLGYQQTRTFHMAEEKVTAWEHRYEYRPGRWAHTDYNFTTPRTSLMSNESTVVSLVKNKSFEIYDYPGEYEDVAEGRRLVKLRMEEEEASHDVARGESTCRVLTPGEKFTFHDFEVRSENGKEYVVTSVEHEATEPGYYEGVGEADNEEERPAYFNRFTCIPATVAFRPRRATRKPLVEGPQTAVVVGPAGEEIYTDKYGRVKVQFHWDREGKRDENSSCWMRVSQLHAGQGWGYMDIPRVGEEVIVSFLEGDPDRPIITGRVYNADNMPPYELPAGKTRRGNKTKTYKGVGYNEMSMDDTPGKEQIRVNAQFNMDSVVGNNETLKVGVDRTTEIGNNDTLKVGNNAAETVGVNKNVTVGQNIVIQAGTSITLLCGASRIHMNQAGFITISGTVITTAASANLAMTSPLTEVVGGVMLSAVGGVTLVEGGVTHIGGGKLVSVTSGGQMDLIASADLIEKGATIKLNG